MRDGEQMFETLSEKLEKFIPCLNLRRMSMEWVKMHQKKLRNCVQLEIFKTRWSELGQMGGQGEDGGGLGKGGGGWRDREEGRDAAGGGGGGAGNCMGGGGSGAGGGGGAVQLHGRSRKCALHWISSPPILSRLQCIWKGGTLQCHWSLCNTTLQQHVSQHFI